MAPSSAYFDPAVRERLWFFTGYQYLRDYDSQPGVVPTLPRRYEQNKVFAKLTWRLRPGLQLMQSLNEERWVNPQTPTRVTPFLAFKAGGSGDISTSHLAWKWTDKGAPDVPTPVSDGERLYMADDQGAITCVNAKTGEKIYGPEQTGIGRTSGSPILADGKIYLTSESAETVVVQAGPVFKQIAKNTLDGSYTLCTPAFVDGEIILRTGTHLYCIAK